MCGGAGRGSGWSTARRIQATHLACLPVYYYCHTGPVLPVCVYPANEAHHCVLERSSRCWRGRYGRRRRRGRDIEVRVEGQQVDSLSRNVFSVTLQVKLTSYPEGKAHLIVIIVDPIL